jgi:hypothetical protein
MIPFLGLNFYYYLKIETHVNNTIWGVDSYMIIFFLIYDFLMGHYLSK